MSCRHYCIEFLKKSFSKTFLFLKIIYKYFAGFLACINNSHSPKPSRRNERKRSNLFSGLLHFIRNDGSKLHSHYEAIAEVISFKNGLLRLGLPALAHYIRNEELIKKLNKNN